MDEVMRIFNVNTFAYISIARNRSLFYCVAFVFVYIVVLSLSLPLSLPSSCVFVVLFGFVFALLFVLLFVVLFVLLLCVLTCDCLCLCLCICLCALSCICLVNSLEHLEASGGKLAVVSSAAGSFVLVHCTSRESNPGLVVGVCVGVGVRVSLI